MIKNLCKKSRTKANILLWTLLGFSLQVRAEIPTTDDFADGADDKGAFETLFWLLEKGVQLIIVGIAAFFVFTIGKAAMKKYNDITEERGSWIDLGGHIVGGIALLALTVVMLNWVGDWVK